MTDTLIARLRDGNLFADRVEAADRIEALTAEIEWITKANIDHVAARVSYHDQIERMQGERELTGKVLKLCNEECFVLTNKSDQLRAEVEQVTAFKDGAYLERNKLVALLSKVFPSGKKKTAIEGWSEDWHGCVYIDLPTGQASWHYHDSQSDLFAHLPEYQGTWDGHTTDEKYERISQFASGAAPQQAEPVCGYDDTTGNCTRTNCCKQAEPKEQK